MIEKHYILPAEVDTTLFYGVNNANMRLLKDLHPNMRIMARGNIIKMAGTAAEVEQMEKNIEALANYSLTTNSLTEEEIIRLLKSDKPIVPPAEEPLLHGVGGRIITPRSENQRLLVKAFTKDDLIFAIGPAGSGKTYMAIALAVKALKNREVKKIILSRPAVEAGEKLGFLPGDLKEKIDPYLQPLYDALQDMIPGAKLNDYMSNGTIQIAPLAYMRGRTLSDAVVILDEAQNTSVQQIKMFLTRLGMGSKMIITGDLTQIDLPPSQKSGLKDAVEVLHEVKGVSTIHFDKEDIVRHRLVQRIVNAYETRSAIHAKQRKENEQEGSDK